MKLTDLLILLCVSFSAYAWSASANFAFSEYALFHGGYYTLITGIFVHAGVVHLLGNMLFLFVFGHALEDEVGSMRLSSVFFTGGVLSFIFSIPFYPGSSMLGASAAIFAVMASLLLVRRPEYSFRFLSPIGPLALLFFIFNIAAIGSQGNVAYVSHVIGFVIGLFFGIRWNREWKKSLILTLLLLLGYVVLYNYVKAWVS